MCRDILRDQIRVLRDQAHQRVDAGRVIGVMMGRVDVRARVDAQADGGHVARVAAADGQGLDEGHGRIAGKDGRRRREGTGDIVKHGC